MDRISDTHWIGKDKRVSIEFTNLKKFVDEDGIERFIVELRDEEKIKAVANEKDIEVRLNSEELYKPNKNTESNIEIVFESVNKDEEKVPEIVI